MATLTEKEKKLLSPEEKLELAKARVSEILSEQKGQMVIHHRAKILLSAARRRNDLAERPIGKVGRKNWFSFSVVAKENQ